MQKAERVPRRIHYCWFGGGPLSELSQRCMETWHRVMPGYDIVRWDEGRLSASSPYVAAANRQKKWAFVADYMRLLALYTEGGIYFDTDIEVIRPFDDLLDAPLFLGRESPTLVGVSVVGAEKGHPFLRAAMERLDAEAKSGKPAFEPLPELVTSLLDERKGDGATVHPEEYFYPYNPYSSDPVRRKPLQSHMSDKTYCIHQWEGAWLGGMSLRMMVGLRIKNMLRKAGLRAPEGRRT